MEDDQVTRTTTTVGDFRVMSFLTNGDGELLGYIEQHPDGHSVSIYEEPCPPPSTTLKMDTRNECLAALTGFLEAKRCLEA